MSTDKFSLKDQLFNRSKVEKIAAEIKSAHPSFDSKSFIDNCIASFPSLELKQRIHHIALTLKSHLPDDFLEAVQILIDSLPPPCNPKLQDNDFGDFIYAPYGDFVAIFGCSEAHLETSFFALEQFTMRFSMEYALRTFINSFPNQTLERVISWCEHEHYHVRRLASEGSRPKLPWGIKILTPPEAYLSVLDRLHTDKTRFVTRSVANHLNDLSKINSELVFTLLNSWIKAAKQDPKELQFITKHALRALIKNGDQAALKCIGFDSKPNLDAVFNRFTNVVKMNDFFEFEIALKARDACKIVADYMVYFQSSKNDVSRCKVFKLKQLDLSADEQFVLSKKHHMRSAMTTRKLYPGLHRFVLQVNGKPILSRDFELVP